MEETMSKQSDGSYGDDNSRIMVGKFTFRGEVKHFARVPRGKIDSESDLLDLLDLWDLPTPNYILETNQSEKRRDKIITKENAAGILRQVFNKTSEVKPAQRQSEPTPPKRRITGLKKPVPSKRATTFQAVPNKPAADEKDLEWLTEFTGQPKGADPDWSWINKYLHRKTIDVLKSIVSAADMVDGWFLCHGAPTSNEKMLEVAMDLTGSAPTILVVDDLGWYNDDGYENGSDAQEGSEMGQGSWGPIKRFIASIEGKGSTIPLEDALRNQEKYEQLLVCDEVGSLDDNLDLSFRRSSNLNPTRNADGSHLWKYGLDAVMTGMWTARFPWTRGTHFIFSEGCPDFEPRLLGARTGFVCMHGGTAESSSSPKRTGYIIRDAIDQLKPCILLDNTGAETQMYAKLIKAIQNADENARKTSKEEEVTPNFWKFPRLWGEAKDRDGSNSETIPDDLSFDVRHFHGMNRYYSGLQNKLHRDAAELLVEANKGHCKTEGLSVLNLADVLDTVDRYCQNPRLFQSIVVPVDPLKDTPEFVVKTLSAGFQRAFLLSREVGAGNADVHAVETAWRLHEQLGNTKRIKHFWRGVLYTLYIVAGFLTTFVALMKDTLEEMAIARLQWPATALAIITSLCVGILNLLSADDQLQSIRNAQARVVHEIFRFRMRVGKYSFNVRDNADDTIDPEEEGADTRRHFKKGRTTRNEGRSKRADIARKQSSNESTKMHASRARFADSIRVIINDMGSVDLYFKDNQTQKRKAEYYVNTPLEVAGRNRSQIQFENYVADQLHLVDASNSCKELALSGLIAPTDYFQIRLLPLLEWVDWHEDTLRYQMRLLQIGNMVLNGSAVVLGAANQVAAIPIVIAGATALFQVLKIQDLERRFGIASTAARELRALESTWRSLGALDRQTQSAARNLVCTCEQIALQFETSSTIQVDKSAIGMDAIDASKPRIYKPEGDLNV